MKTQIYILFIFILFSTKSFSQKHIILNDSTSGNSLTTNKTYLPLLFSPGLDMRSGEETITSIHRGITYFEDNLIDTKWFSESNILGKAGGISGRFAKYAFLDAPLDYFSVVFAHEFFGHGSRYREFNSNDIHYSFDLPPPYGNGGGEASKNGALPVSYRSCFPFGPGVLKFILV